MNISGLMSAGVVIRPPLASLFTFQPALQTAATIRAVVETRSYVTVCVMLWRFHFYAKIEIGKGITSR
jgi:hypothetical protein